MSYIWTVTGWHRHVGTVGTLPEFWSAVRLALLLRSFVSLCFKRSDWLERHWKMDVIIEVTTTGIQNWLPLVGVRVNGQHGPCNTCRRLEIHCKISRLQGCSRWRCRGYIMAWYVDMSFWNRDHESWSYMHCEFPAIKDDNCGSVYIFFTAENHWRLQWLGLFLKGHRVDGTCSTWLASCVWVLFLDTFANVGGRVYLQSSNTKKVKMAIPLKAFLYCHTSVFQWWYKHSITYTTLT